MPVHRSYKNGKPIGWRYGRTGKVYRSRADAVKQAQAILISQHQAKMKGQQDEKQNNYNNKSSG